jgi:hypothetical protein
MRGMRWYETAGQLFAVCSLSFLALPPIVQRFLDLLWWIRR